MKITCICREKKFSFNFLRILDRIKHNSIFKVCFWKLQLYIEWEAMTVYKAFQERLQDYECCWLSHLPYTYPSPVHTPYKHNYLCGVPNYPDTGRATIYVTRDGSHACRLTIFLENKCGLSGAFKDEPNGYSVLHCLHKDCLVPKTKDGAINRAIKTCLTRYPVHVGPWASLSWFLAQLVCSM